MKPTWMLVRTSELDFLRHRVAEAGRVDFTRERFTGTSSNALVRFALGGPMPAEREYPADAADLRACRLTFEMAPPHLRRRMDPVLQAYAAHLEAKSRP